MEPTYVYGVTRAGKQHLVERRGLGPAPLALCGRSTGKLALADESGPGGTCEHCCKVAGLAEDHG